MYGQYIHWVGIALVSVVIVAILIQLVIDAQKRRYDRVGIGLGLAFIMTVPIFISAANLSKLGIISKQNFDVVTLLYMLSAVVVLAIASFLHVRLRRWTGAALFGISGLILLTSLVLWVTGPQT